MRRAVVSLALAALACGDAPPTPQRVTIPPGARWSGDLQGLPWTATTVDGINAAASGSVPGTCLSTKPDPVTASGTFDIDGSVLLGGSVPPCGFGAPQLSVTGGVSADLSTLELRAALSGPGQPPFARYALTLRRVP